MQQQLFEELKMEEEKNGTIANITLNNFLQNNSMGSFDFIYYTQKYLAQKDKALVDMLLYYFPSNNIVDDNYWQYFNWQNNMMDSPSTKPNLTQLLALANKCPLTNGRVVYAARNLYNFLTEDDISFDVECNINSTTSRMVKPPKATIIETVGEVLVFPNPTKDGYIYINLPKTIKPNWYISITNSQGKEITRRNIRTNITKTFIQLNNNSKGLYFVRIVNLSTGKFDVKKLIFE